MRVHGLPRPDITHPPMRDAKNLSGLSLDTLAIHAGQPPDPVSGAVMTPIVLSSTFAQEGLGKHKGFEYARTDNPTRRTLEATGFGLLGHTHELAFASGCAAEIDARAVPAIDGVLDLLSDERALAGGSKRNRADADTFTTWGAVDDARKRLVCDAMTSGGLLAAVPDPAGIDGWVAFRLV